VLSQVVLVWFVGLLLSRRRVPTERHRYWGV